MFNTALPLPLPSTPVLAKKPAVVWFTGLSGAGKTTTATAVQARLTALGYRAFVLDGDHTRRGLCADLGFSATDRRENIRRNAEVAKLLTEAGLIVLACFISPFRADRRDARAKFAPGEFIEVFLDTPLAVCERRDPKGLYARARQGLIPDFTGISSPFEAPERAELVLQSGYATVSHAADRVLEVLRAQGVIE